MCGSSWHDLRCKQVVHKRRCVRQVRTQHRRERLHPLVRQAGQVQRAEGEAVDDARHVAHVADARRALLQARREPEDCKHEEREQPVERVRDRGEVEERVGEEDAQQAEDAAGGSNGDDAVVGGLRPEAAGERRQPERRCTPPR